MADSYEKFRATRYFRSLDALRCVAILGVLWHHCGTNIDGPVLLSRGYLGVDLFFVLSGFLITTILLREDVRTGTISLRDFYVRRTLRIFPLYYAYLAYLCASNLFFHSPTPDRVRFLQAAPYYATYTSNWLPEHLYEPIFARSWSLSVEEQFYLLWPTILVLCGRRRVVPYLVAFVALTFIGEIGDFGSEIEYLANKLVPFSAIAIGVLLAIALDQPRGYGTLACVLGDKGSVLVVVGLLVLLLAIPANVQGLLRLAVHLSMAALVCSVVLREDHVLAKLAHAWPVVHIGVVSYGIYVLHGQFGNLNARIASAMTGALHMPQLQTSQALHFALLVVTSTLAATISYYFFESYFLKLKERFSGRKRRDVGAEPPPVAKPEASEPS
jgi:peptidoglycan/LPS O-acetylase OafA/YrhL